MIELYNYNNLKVYVDSDDFRIIRDDSLLVTVIKGSSLYISISRRDTNACTITVKGSLVTIDGTTAANEFDSITNIEITLKDYSLVVRGDLTLAVYMTQQATRPTYTLYGRTQVISDSDRQMTNQAEYLLQDSSRLSIVVTSDQEPIQVNMYGNSHCSTREEALINAYDNSTIEVYEYCPKVTINAYDNVEVSAPDDTIVTINDESKLTIV